MKNISSSLVPLVLVVSPFCHKLVLCALVNQTIDDTFGDLKTGHPVIYTPPLEPPPSLWVDQTCQGCAILPSDPPQAFEGTFHGAAYNPSVPNPISFQLNFTGIAVYVFFTVVNNANTFVDFTIDGEPAGTFNYAANTELITRYQVPVLAITDLPPGPHSLLASVTSNTLFSYINFDYAKYTQDIPEPSSLSSPVIVPTMPRSQDPTSRASSKSSVTVSSSSVASTPNGPLLSVTPSTSAQRNTSVISVTTSFSTVAANTTPSVTPTSKIVVAAKPNGRAYLVLAAEVLAPIAIVAAAALLLCYRQSQNQAKRKRRKTTPFADPLQENPPHDGLEIFVQPSRRKSHGRVSALLLDKVRDDLRRTRQADIDQRLRILRGEIVEISAKLSARGALVPADDSEDWSPAALQHHTRPSNDVASSRRLRRMMNVKRRLIEHHEQQRQSPWALGLSEESPFENSNALL